MHPAISYHVTTPGFNARLFIISQYFVVLLKMFVLIERRHWWHKWCDRAYINTSYIVLIKDSQRAPSVLLFLRCSPANISKDNYNLCLPRVSRSTQCRLFRKDLPHERQHLFSLDWFSTKICWEGEIIKVVYAHHFPLNKFDVLPINAKFYRVE